MVYIDSDTINKLSLRILSKYKKTVLFLAVLFLLCGTLCLLIPVYSGIALSYLIGSLFVISGVYSFVSAFAFIKNTSSFFSLLLFGIIYAFLGVSFLSSPMIGMNILSMLICILFLLGGLSRLTTAFNNSEMIGRYWCIFIGILDFAIAFLWLSAGENTSYLLTVMLIGLEMVLTSWFFFMLNYGLNHHKDSYSGA
ncbi:MULTISPECIES: DUF308 domain-containing protein [unclassified Serratia (in: enterobacteria)]|uniref:DUF308 domain-containing protein n=1 Tax=unclassified Serratia (in: enterobacteria) TaxID=2647522 RepID=UPI001CC07BB7|nr:MULTISPECIES: DUF308 domain-containing protein [unclassified Serratia (in: enterobacteria)]UAN57483.1 DUF308 domain-containing protein [Serratia sp. JSRIV004]UAN62985.1 DUF308 domain-containing protein [Serratia sp. JSRIV006]